MSRAAPAVRPTRTEARSSFGCPPRAGMVRSGDGRSWVWPTGGADLPAQGDPLVATPRGVAGCRGLNAIALQKPAIAADDVGLVTEATEDVCDFAHAQADERGDLLCSKRVPPALRRARLYHASDMVTRYRVRELASGGMRVRAVERVERVSFETRECELAQRERRLREQLDVELGYATGADGRSFARPWEL